jgi:dienelactone hydrolase
MVGDLKRRVYPVTFRTARRKFTFAATKDHPVQTQDVRYSEGEVEFLGYLAFDETARDKRPGVLVVHEGLGLGEHIMERARRIAELGYVVFAADMFGGRRQASDLQDMSKLIGDLRNDLPKLRARGRAALARLGSLPQVDATRLAAVGFCFGGSVVLELARDGANVKAVVSLHGVLSTKAPAETDKIRASVLVCTGADDPLAPPDQVAAFENEMRAANVRDWQVITYGNTLHAFTNPIAGPSTMRGTLYNEKADRRSWVAVRNFLEELLDTSLP